MASPTRRQVLKGGAVAVAVLWGGKAQAASDGVPPFIKVTVLWKTERSSREFVAAGAEVTLRRGGAVVERRTADSDGQALFEKLPLARNYEVSVTYSNRSGRGSYRSDPILIDNAGSKRRPKPVVTVR